MSQLGDANDIIDMVLSFGVGVNDPGMLELIVGNPNNSICKTETAKKVGQFLGENEQKIGQFSRHLKGNVCRFHGTMPSM